MPLYTCSLNARSRISRRAGWARALSVALAAALIGGVDAWAEAPSPDTDFGRKLVVLAEPMEIVEAPILTLDGPTDLTAFRGEVTVLMLWATWCHICKLELPAINELAGEMAGNGVRIVTLSLDEGDDALARVDAYFQARGYAHLPVMVDLAQIHAKTLGIRGTPTTFILNRDGLMVATIEGFAHWDSPEARAYLLGLAAE